jgi:DNA-binding GntR family transcriptional regulator
MQTAPSALPRQPIVDSVAAPPRPPLAARALYEQVADRLPEEIFSRRLEPGSWIDELRLASEYGISRTPLREAL